MFQSSGAANARMPRTFFRVAAGYLEAEVSHQHTNPVDGMKALRLGIR